MEHSNGKADDTPAAAPAAPFAAPLQQASELPASVPPLAMNSTAAPIAAHELVAAATAPTDAAAAADSPSRIVVKQEPVPPLMEDAKEMEEEAKEVSQRQEQVAASELNMRS
jgi:hypothetical protein